MFVFLKPGPSGSHTIRTDVSKGQDMIKADLWVLSEWYPVAEYYLVFKEP